MIPSYSQIYNLGHKAVLDILRGPVIVEEKIDGSLISFAILNGNLEIRSKGSQLFVDAPEKLFALGISYIDSIKDTLRKGWIYRGEYLAKPKHNALAYDRIPLHNIIIFDIETPTTWLYPCEKAREVVGLGLETVPVLFDGMVNSMDQIKEFLDRNSVLGGQKVEGVVIKPLDYDIYGIDKKVLMAKYVSEAFREVHTKSWKDANPSQGDVIAILIGKLKTTS